MKEAHVYDLQEEKTKRKSTKRRARMPAIVDAAIALLKSAERKALLQSIDNPDPAQCERARVYAAAMDAAAVMVLAAFDQVTRKPSP